MGLTTSELFPSLFLRPRHRPCPACVSGFHCAWLRRVQLRLCSRQQPFQRLSFCRALWLLFLWRLSRLFLWPVCLCWLFLSQPSLFRPCLSQLLLSRLFLCPPSACHFFSSLPAFSFQAQFGHPSVLAQGRGPEEAAVWASQVGAWVRVVAQVVARVAVLAVSAPPLAVRQTRVRLRLAPFEAGFSRPWPAPKPGTTRHARYRPPSKRDPRPGVWVGQIRGWGSPWRSNQWSC